MVRRHTTSAKATGLLLRIAAAWLEESMVEQVAGQLYHVPACATMLHLDLVVTQMRVTIM